jgi:hypothetical protein
MERISHGKAVLVRGREKIQNESKETGSCDRYTKCARASVCVCGAIDRVSGGRWG